MSGKPITDFIDDNNMKFILEHWLRVRIGDISLVSNGFEELEEWEHALVLDVKSIFG